YSKEIPGSAVACASATTATSFRNLAISFPFDIRSPASIRFIASPIMIAASAATFPFHAATDIAGHVRTRKLNTRPMIFLTAAYKSFYNLTRYFLVCVKCITHVSCGVAYALVSAVVTDEIERDNAVVIAGDSFAIDNAGARA